VTQVEQDFELAAGEYEHHNNPLFHSFYYMQ
jgi:hypothetical protein